MTTGVETYRYGRLHVAYFDVDVPAVVIGRAVYFPLRSLCLTLGVASQMQVKRVRADSRFQGAVRTVPVPTIKGLRDTLCVEKRHVAIWLATMEPARLSPRVRGRVEQFQAELFAAADRFLFGDTRDVTYDAGTKSSSPLGGYLRVGHCPGCGMSLVLGIDDTGPHLQPDETETPDEG